MEKTKGNTWYHGLSYGGKCRRKLILCWRSGQADWIGAGRHRLRRLPQRPDGSSGGALDAGGTVTGVEPQFFVRQGLQRDGLAGLIVTKDMTERKTEMIQAGAMPSSHSPATGTLEEIAEVMSRSRWASWTRPTASCIV